MICFIWFSKPSTGAELSSRTGDQSVTMWRSDAVVLHCAVAPGGLKALRAAASYHWESY